RDMVHYGCEYGERKYAHDGQCRKFGTNLFISQPDERDVQYSNQISQLDVKHLGADDADPCDPSIRNLVGNQYRFKSICGDEGSEHRHDNTADEDEHSP